MSEENHFKQIYAQQAEGYDAIIRCHDVEGNLLPALTDLHPLEGSEVVEFGAGTGRVTALLAPRVRTIRAFDESEAMLAIAERRLAEANITNVTLAPAPNTGLPVEDNSADLTIQGWSFGHATGWYPDSWRDEIGKMLAEMSRITRLGGTLINIETQGTGFETPRAPSKVLAGFGWITRSTHWRSRKSGCVSSSAMKWGSGSSRTTGWSCQSAPVFGGRLCECVR
jgi:ubiquinone/menaquinone biosynthesis C-methylase UbiE